MERRGFSRKPHGGIELDLCFACHAIWFDHMESAQLTPKAVIDLFAQIHQHHDQPPRTLADRLRCPSCRESLKLTQDIQRTNRISYYRCTAAHGRLTTFLQFLREKNFVRTLTAPEVAQLKATVTQVRCSGCGAPVDLTRDSACGFCRSPISILDADAVKRTLAELSSAERASQRVADPAQAVQAVLAGHRSAGASDHRGPRLDLVSDALDFLMSD